jgi:thiol-disulfide isomerase/thioredoxin
VTNFRPRVVIGGAIILLCLAVVQSGCNSPTKSSPVPAPITNFTAVIGLSDRVLLEWSAPAEIAGVTAVSFDLRYSTSEMSSSAAWNSAIKMNDLPAPATAGVLQQYELSGLAPLSVYYVAMRVNGNNGNQSQFSQQLILRTADTASARSYTLSDFDGTMHSSSEWLGHRLVFMNFWGVWCGYCTREMPDLATLHDTYLDSGLFMVGMDHGDSFEEARDFIASHNIDWLNLYTPDSIERLYHISGVPTTVFLDSGGTEIGRVVGARSFSSYATIVNYLFARSADRLSTEGQQEIIK